MGIEATVGDPTKLIAKIDIAEHAGREWIVIEYNGEEPLYKLETRPTRATLTIKEGKSRRKAIIELSGILSFPPRDVPNRCVIVRTGESRTAALAPRA